MYLFSSFVLRGICTFEWCTFDGHTFAKTLFNLSKSYVLSLSFNPTTKIGVVFENYGEFNDSFKSYFDLGIGYLVSPVLQFDIYLGIGLENKPEDLFINLGVTYRFNL